MITPHGHELIDRVVPESRRGALLDRTADDIRIELDRELLFDLVNVATGRYSPLTGFMGSNDLSKVLTDVTLETGEIWPLPVVLDVPAAVAERLETGQAVRLDGPDGEAVGTITVDEVYEFDPEPACIDLFGTVDGDHPGVDIVRGKDPFLVAGEIKTFAGVVDRYGRYDLTPTETRVLFDHHGWETVAGFQTRNVPHRAHEYLQKSTLEHVDGIFIQPKVGRKKSGDYTDTAILSGYESLLESYYPDRTAAVGVFPSRMWYGGPREAVFDAIVRKNHGCTHFIVGRDHAGVADYYDDFAAQALFDRLPDIGIEPMYYDYSFFCTVCDTMASEQTCPHDSDARVEPSGTELRGLLGNGERPSPKLMRPEVADTVLTTDDVFVER
jgi:sulfate adenylyltransferase